MSYTIPTSMSRRQLLKRVGVGTGAVVLLAHGGRALASPAAHPHSLRLGADGLPATTDKAHLSYFGRMFPGLARYGDGFSQSQVIDDLQVLTSASTASPANSATSPLVEPGGQDDTLNGAIYTYFGQMINAHDLTLDPTPLPSAPVDPNTIPNYETFFMDLSSMYGGGPKVSPQLYNADARTFLTRKNINGVADLPRRADGSAIIVELRDDENEITSQLLYAFEQFHNAIAATYPAWSFARVARHVRHYVQFLELTDWLPQMATQAVVDGLLSGSIPRYYKPGSLTQPMTPIEWSVATERAHPMIRNAYAMELTTNGVQSFPNNRTTLFAGQNGATAAANADLHGGYPLPADHVIDWGNFVEELARGDFNPANGTDSFLQAFKQLIPQLGASAFLLPVGGPSGAVASGSQNLAYRDLVRGYFYGMATGQAVAAKLGNPVISPEDVLTGLPTPVDPSTVPSLAAGTPLWLYNLAEAYITQSAATAGQPAPGTPGTFAAYLQPNKAGTFQPDHFGPTGATILADVMLRVLEIDPDGILNPNVHFTPKPPIAPSKGVFQTKDLLLYAGVAIAP